MDGVVNELTARAAAAAFYGDGDGDARVFIGLVGAPGSGKSTLAREIVARVNAAAGADVAVVFPMDGFHYYLSQLADATLFPDGEEAARSRRGAPWTFDADAFVRRVADAKRSRDAVVRVPEFDHEVHDPEEDKIAIAPTHKIVVVEGNYLTLPDAPWSELHSGDAPLLDEVWHLDCSVDDAMARVTRRHVAVGRSAAAMSMRPSSEVKLRSTCTCRNEFLQHEPQVPTSRCAEPVVCWHHAALTWTTRYGGGGLSE